MQAENNVDAWETPCSEREDRVHCEHWYDGLPCCACGDPADPDAVGAS